MNTKIVGLDNAIELPADRVGYEGLESGSVEELMVLQLAVASAYVSCEPGLTKASLARWAERIEVTMKERDRLPF